MKYLIRNIRLFVIVFAALFALVIAGGVSQSSRARTTWLEAAGENKDALRSRYKTAGKIISADNVILAESDERGQRRYAENRELAQAALHLVGDYTHNISNTLESLWQDRLLGNSRGFLNQLRLDIAGKGLLGDDLLLTVQSDLMIAAHRALSDKKGAIVILNYQTGEVLALVSCPTVDPGNVVEWKNIPDTALFNRALLGRYLPGSTFKIVTSAAFLGQTEIDRGLTVACKGKEPLMPGGVFERYIKKGTHGTVDLEKAFTTSCNHFFGDVGINLGAEALERAAQAFGFNTGLALDRMKMAVSVCDIGHGDLAALSWASIGQAGGADIECVTPMHLAMIAGAVANEGIMRQPFVVDKIRSPLGSVQTPPRSGDTVAVTDRETAEKLAQMMRSVVTSGTGKNANVKGLDIRGKTGTADITDEKGELKTNNLFAGFIADRRTPIAIGVVLEDSASGSAALVAGRLLRLAAGLK